MNIQSKINKLILALSQKGHLYKINTFQSYLEEEKRFIKKYQILKRELVDDYDEEKETYIKVWKFIVKDEFYGKIKLLKYFVNEYKKVKGGSNGL